MKETDVILDLFRSAWDEIGIPLKEVLGITSKRDIIKEKGSDE